MLKTACSFCALSLVALGLSSPAMAIDGLKYTSKIEAFYQTQGTDFLWLNRNGTPQKQVQLLMDALENSWQHGLNPENYHVEDLRNYLASHQNIAPRFFDEMMSDALLRYVRDMSGMRVDPSLIEQDRRYWRQDFNPSVILSQVSNPGQLSVLFQKLEAQGPLYTKLKEELVRLIQAPHDAPQIPMILTQADLLRPGAIHSEFVPLLRTFLGVPAQDWQQNVYDDELVRAVIAFQRKNGLKADGIIGPKTLALMNKTPQEKIYQIIANMERLRWLSPQKPFKYVLVNIPSATLWAIEDEKIAAQMPVIVGRKDRPTMSFVSEITGVRFNPTWTVPKTIKKEDFLPLLRKDPHALIAKGIDIQTKSEQSGWMSIDPAAIDWSQVMEDDLGHYQMVQGAGPTNPLGRVRVLMPNQYNIYLHDTSSPEYFRASDRMVSSGCVRVKEPVTLANFIMSSKSGWTPDNAQELLDQKKMRDVFLPQTIPVYLLYLTVWLNEDGTLTYGPDIYEWDQLMTRALQQQKLISTQVGAVSKTGTALAYRN